MVCGDDSTAACRKVHGPSWLAKSECRQPLGNVLHSSNELGELSQWRCHNGSTTSTGLGIIIIIIISIIIIIIIIMLRLYLLSVLKHEARRAKTVSQTQHQLMLRRIRKQYANFRNNKRQRVITATFAVHINT